MPATSLKQKKFMDAVAHNPAFAKKVEVPQAIGKDFSEASKGMKFSGGSRERPDLQKINKPDTKHGSMEIMKKGGKTASTNKSKESQMATKKMAKGGMTEATMGKVRTNPGNINGVAEKGKTKGTVIKMSGSTPLGMNKGGMAKMKRGGKAC
jgi:hypothetical protein